MIQFIRLDIQITTLLAILSHKRAKCELRHYLNSMPDETLTAFMMSALIEQYKETLTEKRKKMVKSSKLVD